MWTWYRPGTLGGSGRRRARSGRAAGTLLGLPFAEPLADRRAVRTLSPIRYCSQSHWPLGVVPVPDVEADDFTAPQPGASAGREARRRERLRIGGAGRYGRSARSDLPCGIDDRVAE